jgi:hypothetical protein
MVACRFAVDPITNESLFSYKEHGIDFVSKRFQQVGIRPTESTLNSLHSNMWIINPSILFWCINTELCNRRFNNARDFQQQEVVTPPSSPAPQSP